MDYVNLLKKLNVKNYESIGKCLNNNFLKFGITNQENQLFFLANCLNESGCFTNFVENMSYSTADRLKLVFPTAFNPLRFPLTAKYNPFDYVKNPEKLGNLVYDDRIFKKGLGNIFDGDGYKYRGRGAIQITGRNNYKIASEISGIDFINNPELLGLPENALIGSLSYWKHNNIHLKTSLLATRQVVAGNYTNNPFGIKEVTDYYNKIKALI